METGRPAGEIFNEGLALMQANRFSEAITSFEELDQYYPYSENARRGLVLTAYANLQLGRYEEAITAAERFIALYPTHVDAAYALFILGQAHGRQVLDVTRDQSEARLALAAFDTLVTQFPASEYVPQARIDMRALNDQLAGQEMQVGRYYQERREYVAAVNRFQNVVENYQTTRHVEEALLRLTEVYLAMGLASEAQTAAAVLGHNFPDSPWYDDAFALLQAAGLAPAENTGSAISRAFR